MSNPHDPGTVVKKVTRTVDVLEMAGYGLVHWCGAAPAAGWYRPRVQAGVVPEVRRRPGGRTGRHAGGAGLQRGRLRRALQGTDSPPCGNGRLGVRRFGTSRTQQAGRRGTARRATDTRNAGKTPGVVGARRGRRGARPAWCSRQNHCAVETWVLDLHFHSSLQTKISTPQHGIFRPTFPLPAL